MTSIKRFILIKGIILLFIFANYSTIQAQTAIADGIKNETKDDLTIYRNLRYAAKPDSFENDIASDRTLDLYLPASSKGKLPVIVFIHGGGFSGGDKEGTEAVCTKLSSLGYAVLSINYRLELKRKKVSGAGAGANLANGLPVTGKFHPALHNAISIASEDTQLALKWIKENASQYKLKTSAVALCGGSAGGMTALYTAYISNQKILPIKAVVNLWGGLENTELIKKNAPPVLTYHGDLDKLIHVDFAYAIKKQMEKTGNTKSELYVMEGKGHARYDIIAKEKTEEIDAFLRKVF
jgi:para-nitrobenzyl esterase